MVLEHTPLEGPQPADQDSASPSALQVLGLRLRQAREAQDLSREELAARLHMGPEQFAALEEGRRDCLPEAAFVIAQARRIAGTLGVGIDAEVEALRRDPAFAPTPSARLSGPRSTGARPSGACPSAAGSALSPDRPAAASAVAMAPERQPRSPGTDHRRPPSSRARSAWLLRGALPVAGLALLAALVLQGRQALQGRGPAAQPGSASLFPHLRPSPPSSSPLRRAPAGPGAGGPGRSPAAPADPAVLVLASRGASWLEVTTGDRRLLFRGTLQGQRSFPLGAGLRVLAGRPDLVTARIGAAPAQPLGAIDQVRWRRFTAPAP